MEIAKLSLLVSSLPLGNSWRIEQRDALIGSAHLPVPPTVWVTNPPWRNPKGSQAEAATRFLGRAVESLADGGLLACILPASWLSGKQHRASRREVAALCNLFEIWRLPRDMFAPDARFPGCGGVRSEGEDFDALEFRLPVADCQQPTSRRLP